MINEAVPRALVLAAAGAFVDSNVCSAQIGGAGSIRGAITDPSGAVIPGAMVIAVNVATNVTTSRPASDTGYYVLSPLSPGFYRITVTAQGFRTLTQEQVEVQTLTVVGLDLKLQVGAAAETITVTDAPRC